MDKYKAQRNDVEEQPQKTQDEIDTENNANNIKNAAEVAANSANPYAKAAGYAVKGLDKITGGKSTEALGKTMTKANKMAPGGRQIQNASNKLSESGASDKVGQAAAAKSGGKGGAAGAAKSGAAKSGATKGGSKLSFGSSSSGGSTSSSFDGNILSNLPAPLKMKLILFGFGALIFVSILFSIFAGKDNANLLITNASELTDVMKRGSRKCTESGVSSKLMYVGDSRIENMKNAVQDDSITYITNGGGNYEWFSNEGITNVDSQIVEKPNQIIVFNLGINDLDNVDNYINKYNELITKYPDTKFFILSVNPVDESDTNISVTNDDISLFNSKMYKAFPNYYIDSSKNLNNFTYVDGVNFTDETYVNINNYAVKALVDNPSITCGGGNISDITDEDLGGGGAKMLNQSLTSLLGESGVQSWTDEMNSAAQSAGYGTGLAPATVAYTLVRLALDQGVIIPYFYGGGHEQPHLMGINGEWGGSKRIWIGSDAQPTGSMQPYGMDCSAFTSWAMRNGGCSSFNSILADQFVNLGTTVPPSEVEAGDMLSNGKHVMIALSNDGSNIIVAEAKGAKYGIIFTKLSYDAVNAKYVCTSMADYYAENCKG